MPLLAAASACVRVEQVRLDISKGLGLSVEIAGNEVQVIGFVPVLDGETSPAQACGQIQASAEFKHFDVSCTTL